MASSDDEKVPLKKPDRQVAGLRWFYHAKGDGSLESYERVDPFKQLIVCWSCPGKIMGNYTEPERTTRLYHAFEYIDFFRFHNKMKPEFRCFFEIVLGDCRQKPKFDLDIPGEITQEVAQRSCEFLIESLIVSMKELYKVDLVLDRDILLYTSHDSTKHSYHIVIDHYCHESHKHAVLLYDMVATRMSQDPDLIIPDRAVYSSFQQFRILNSRKYNTTRVKVFQREWKLRDKLITYRYPNVYESEQQRDVVDFFNSFITYTSFCSNLQEGLILPPAPPRVFSDRIFTDEDLNRIFDVCRNHSGFRGYFPFILTRSSSSCITLRRQAKSFCPKCQREHEHENPFLYVTTDGNIYFNCRRAAKHVSSDDGVLVTKSDSYLVGRFISQEEELRPQPIFEPPIIEFFDDILPLSSKAPTKKKEPTKEDGMLSLYSKSKNTNREIKVIPLDDDEILCKIEPEPDFLYLTDPPDIDHFQDEPLPLSTPTKKKKKKVIDKEVYIHRKRLLDPTNVASLGVSAPESIDRS